MNHSMRLKFIITLISGFLFIAGKTQNDSLYLKLDDLFKDINHTRHPGFSLSILKNGKVTFRNSYGMANLENGIPFKEETVSDLGSMAKHITNVAILYLINEHKLAFSDALSVFFPTLKNKPGGKITLLQLMQHTSGIREIYSKLALQGGRMGQPIFQEDALHLLEISEDLNFSPGSAFSYCNTGYMLLAEIIQKVSHLSYESFLNEKIFRPLAMDRSFVMDIQGEVFPNQANSYQKQLQNWTSIYDNSTAFGQGGIYMSQLDIEKWFIYLTSPDINKEKPIYTLLKKAVLTNGDTLNYALGIEMGSFNNITYWQHTGSSAGFRTSFTWIPATNEVIILKSNYSSFDAIRTTNDIISLLFSQKIEEELPAKKIKPDPAPISINMLEAQRWAGDYYCKEMDVRYSFLTKENKLICSHEIRGQAEVKITPEGIYSARPFFTSLRPAFDKNGNITHIFMDTADLIHLKFEKMR